MTKTTKGKIRYTPDKDELAFISFNLTEFQKDAAALILDESSQGACLVINRKLIPPKLPITEGLYFLVKIGNLEPQVAVVRWVNLVDDDLLKIGIELES